MRSTGSFGGASILVDDWEADRWKWSFDADNRKFRQEILLLQRYLCSNLM